MKIIAYTWFTALTTVGIIVCKNQMGEFKAFINCAEGTNEEVDLERIKDWGCHFPLREAVSVCNTQGTIKDQASFTEIKNILKQQQEVQ